MMLSSVCLRASRSKSKKLCNPTKVACTLCGKNYLLGKTTYAVAHIEYSGEQWTLCASCCDVVADMARYGARLVEDAKGWELSTMVLRVSKRDDTLMCFRCGKVNAEHVFMIFDDLKRMPIRKGRCDGSVRLCIDCFMSALHFLQESDVVRSQVFKYCEPMVFVRLPGW